MYVAQQLVLTHAVQLVSPGSMGHAPPPEELLDVETPLLEALEALDAEDDVEEDIDVVVVDIDDVEPVLAPPEAEEPPVPVPAPPVEVVPAWPPAPPNSTLVVPQPPPSAADATTIPTATNPTKLRCIAASSEGPSGAQAMVAREAKRVRARMSTPLAPNRCLIQRGTER